MAEVKYVRNELGGVHQVSLEHFEALHTKTPNGTKVIAPGWAEVTEDQAREHDPRIFGAPDPDVRLNAKELRDQEAMDEALERAEARTAKVRAAAAAKAAEPEADPKAKKE